MAGKNSFVLYTDMRESLAPLTDEEVGKLIRATFDYVEYGTMPALSGGLLMAFSFLKVTLDRDATKWESARAAKSEGGKKGAAARWDNKA